MENTVIGDRGREVRIFPDPKGLSHAAADLFRLLAGKAMSDGGRFAAALSGGSTPKGLYTILAEKPYCDQIAWGQVHLFWADERCVPMTHNDSNAKLVHDLLISRVAIPQENVHRIAGELGAVQAAADYERFLRTCFNSKGYPRFDLVILGAGADGHTASLFPGSALLQEGTREVIPVHREKPDVDRVSLTLPVLNHAANVLFLVAGNDKADIVYEVLKSDNRKQYPAGLVQPTDGTLSWFLDEAAASRI